MEYIKYKDVSKYKYELTDDYLICIDIQKIEIDTPYIKLNKLGFIEIKAGYRWDGPSGPSVDTKNFMRGSLVHDALYQLMREGKLKQKHRNYADRLLQRMCKKDGMSSFRAWYIYQAVDKFGKSSARKGASDEKIYRAP